MQRFCFLFVLVLLSGCDPFPNLDDSISDQARQTSYPGLDPVDRLLAGAARQTQDDPATEIAALHDRARLLKARAAILRKTDIISPQAQTDMKAAYQRLNP